jgi:HPt (histidine-containing phosphotransfer) domain-containing protein
MPVAATQSRPVDLVHLSRYTSGDAALNAEVLQLFVGQAGELLGRLERAIGNQDSKVWRETTHGLKGAARGIGAFSMAEAAAMAEPVDPATNAERAKSAFGLLKSRAEEVRLFIEAYLGH